VSPEEIVAAVRSLAGRARKPEAWAFYAGRVMERRAA